MFELIDRIPQGPLEFIGGCVGGFACLFIALQLVRELRDSRRSSLSVSYIFGFLAVYGFWMVYGLRFRALALWAANAVAIVLQALLLFAVLRKRGR